MSAAPPYSEVPERVRSILENYSQPQELKAERLLQFASVQPRNEDKEGDTETINRVTITHHFVEVPGDHETVRFHYVEAGSGEVVVFLHGIPDSWYLWHHSVAALSSNYRCIAFDLKGYGQSEKKPGDYRHEGVADQMYAAFDKIGITASRFNIVAHDRGTVQADYIAAKHPEAVLRYGRGEQHLYHFNPLLAPQEKIFRDAPWTGVMEDPKRFVVWLYTNAAKRPVSHEDLVRAIQEYSYPGVTRAVPRYFNSSSFRAEWLDRRNRLLTAIKCPVLIMQGYDSRTTPRELYENSRDYLPNSQHVEVAFLPGGHFWPAESPAETVDALHSLLALPIS
ncbi:alpha/beta hydrolase [Talaromyces proteolyticus]|uniref:Alpha/beta hydrolase n=1 Tax=Talaromyces proteolyticus TaxID=1131652 RepID=A0AAD4KY94_9EURO|nr:alpha/beta hydrolase [Talaromyces proteolyticus]KAH8698736.1 alpha/beta hydrolase [Talaromyces proteolyticus]